MSFSIARSARRRKRPWHSIVRHDQRHGLHGVPNLPAPCKRPVPPRCGNLQGNRHGWSRLRYADPYSEFVGPKFPASILPPVLADFVGPSTQAMGADLSALAMAALAAVGAALTSETKVQVVMLGTSGRSSCGPYR